MKIFMVGGTGLIGNEVAKELIARNHEIISITLPPLPKGLVLPKEMKLVFGNYLNMSDQELLLLMNGCEGFVFAAGIDERVESAPPIYDLFKKYNIDSLERLLRLAKESGITHSAICGSYFSHFAKKWPELNLTKHHPYIRSRIDQEEMIFSFRDNNFNIAILELPYIFGTQPGRKPVWVFLVEMIKNMKKATFFPKGGTAMITIKQAAEAICGALEKNSGVNTYPIGFYNLEWKEFLKIVHQAMGYSENRKIITIPSFLFKIIFMRIDNARKKQGIEGGLKMSKFAKIQTSKLFIDPSEASVFLGVKDDDLNKAVFDSIKLSLEILENKDKNIIDMKGE